MICDTLPAKFGPLTPTAAVPSLVNEDGHFYTFERMAELHALRFSDPTDIPDLMFGLAKEYRLALRVIDWPMIEKVQGQGLLTIEHIFLDSFGLDLATKTAYFRQLLRSLTVGLSE